ncbi:hypothetical protein [Kribbella sp. NPDC049227]|uniref:hypothetical protein n=1 Tax=Kribbella sp. NPDC049227 TaxID=3364113 RepID=UPI00371CF6AA
MNASEHCAPSYQVVVLGELKPAVLAFCAGPQAQHATSGAFRLQVRDGQGIADLVAMLQNAGLVILSIRQVTSPDVPASASLSA